MTAPALAARGIEFAFPGGPALLRGIDLEVGAGEIVGLLGPNGSGKTTLLNVLSATLRPGRGEVMLFGKPGPDYSARERARKLAVVAQESVVAFPFSVLEIALMGRTPYLGRWELEGRGDREIAAAALARTGVDHLAGRRFHDLSSGEKQRVMVAKALAQESPLLFLDEPTAFLDLKHQVEVFEIVAGLVRERGLAVLAVSHDVNLAAMFCDRLLVLAEGRIAAAGAPAEVLAVELLQKVYGVRIGSASVPQRRGAPLIFPLRSGN